MQEGNLAEIVDTLTPELQAAVRDFIDFRRIVQSADYAL